MKNQSVPLVGGFYADDTKSWSAQDCVNWLPTQAEKEGTRTPAMLKTPPGLREFTLTSAHPLTLSGHITGSRIYDTGTYQYGETGGVPPYGSITVTVGALPTGASMSTAGLVTYTYTTPGAFSWTISGDDSNGTIATHHDSLTIPSEILTTWNDRYMGMAQQLYTCTVSGGIILVGGNSTATAYSLDAGATWTVVANGLGGWSPQNCIKFNGDWYMFSNNVTASRALGDTFAFTAMGNAPNNANNTASILTSPAYPTGALYLGAYFTTNSTLLRMNTPGAAWTAIDTGFAYGDVVAICQAGSVYFVVCASGKILKSTDLVTFTLSHDTADSNVIHCAYLASANVVIVTTSGGTVYRSADLGATWTPYVSQGVASVTATRQEFLGGGTSDVLKSTDGITWTVVYTNAGGQHTTNFATDGTVAAIGRINGHVDVGTL